MRGITGTVVLLLTVGYLASTIDLPLTWSDTSEVQVRLADGWRRTADGWEWHEVWNRSRTTEAVEPKAWRIHPVNIAMLQILISIFALCLAERRSDTVRQLHAC